jgi:hypothetical protein
MSVSINGTTGLVFNDGSTQPTAASGFGFKNRIINGDMRIDQRNAGATVTINSTGNTYSLDRWNSSGQLADGVYTVQRSTTAPTGFTNSLVVSVTTADASIGSTQSYLFTQFIEGLNTYDLAWGTASASAVTLSFWVRSSVTGTFGGALRNSAGDRSYPFTYTISSADTWEYKTITIAGDTSGTWLTTTGIGIAVFISLGAGATLSGTAGSWAGANYQSATGATSVVGTNGATFYITGVQLEVGSVATPFERRPYGTELALCQRYYQNGGASLCGTTEGTTIYSFQIQFLQEMRTAPTSVARSGQYFNVRYSGGDVSILNPTTVVANTTSTGGWGYVTSSGLTANLPIVGRQQNSGQSNFIGFSAEL